MLIKPFVYPNNNKVINPTNQENAKQWIQHQPVQFHENKGQMIDMAGNPVPDVLFKTSAPGIDLYITERGLTYVFISSSSLSPEGRGDSLYEKFITINVKREVSPLSPGEL